MDRSLILTGLTIAALASAGSPATASAAPDPIKGKLSKRGYTVIALAKSGKARATDAKRKFRLVPPARKVTLHLRDRDGEYAGPIVVGGTKKKAVVGVRAGAELARVKIKRGYAVATPDDSDVVGRMKARARKRRPIGAGVLGRVSSESKGRGGLGRDPDKDGLPGAFDVDDDGDLVFDNVDRSANGARAAAAEDEFNARWVINGGLEVSYLADDRGITHGVSGYTLNQNAAGPFAANDEFEKLRDLLMVERGALFFPLPGGSAELDCGGLSYCSAGGTGFFATRNRKFPEQFDSDGDKFGSMDPMPQFAEGQDGLGLIQSVNPSSVFGLAPNAKAADIDAGDTYLERTGPETARPVTLRSVIGTLPALAGWGDSTRNVTIDYPVPRGAEGAENNGFTVRPSSTGDHVIRLTIWRPQRQAIAGSGEGTGWVDIGGLTYTVVGKTAEQNRRLFKCEGSSYSTTDGNLSVTPTGLLDKAADEPVNVANTLTFFVNLTDCLRDSGITDTQPPTITIFVSASSAFGDDAEGVGFAFKLVPQDAVGSDQFTGTWKFTGGSPGESLDWTIRANSASTSRMGVIVYDNKTVTGGTPPAGWSCAPAPTQSGHPNDMYLCEGSTLSPGESASGKVTLNAAYDQSKPVEMLICDASNACQGLGMTYSP